MASEKDIKAEQGATAPAQVVVGLGYPNGRDSISAEPTGWQPPAK